MNKKSQKKSDSLHSLSKPKTRGAIPQSARTTIIDQARNRSPPISPKYTSPLTYSPLPKKPIPHRLASNRNEEKGYIARVNPVHPSNPREIVLKDI